MKKEDLKNLVREYVQHEKELKVLKDIEKRQREIKNLITQEMESRNLEKYNFAGRFITYIKSYVRPAYEVPETTISASVRIQGGVK